MNSLQAAIYIMANQFHGTIYIGVTNDLIRRVYEHKHSKIVSFTKRYNCKKLVYYEIFDSIYDAISREKQLKSGSRNKKIMLIEKMNPNWNDLYETLL